MESLPEAVQTDPLLDNLTAPQLEASTHVDGPLLVLAGPGSGKTRVITTRIAYLINRADIAPWNVLAITFTNKAAQEMRQRVGQMVSEKQSRALTIATFHSLCARLLREFGEKVDLVPGYSIYDSSDQKRAVKQALSNLQMSSTNYSPSAILSKISNAKNQMLGPQQYAHGAADFASRQAAKVYKQYAKILKNNNALDFDDLLFKTVELFKNAPDVLEHLRGRFLYVLIDEYQDTNHAQFVIANALAAQHKNLCVTGDPDQSIYGWRGANISNILDFEEQYPEAKVVRLEQNYRSTPSILAAADALIQKNTARKHKQLWTQNSDGPPVQVVTCRDEKAEASFLVEQFIKLNRQQGVAWSDMAVFYRINSLSRVLEDAFRRAGIAYQVARGTEFYHRKEIKDAVGFLHVVVNLVDQVNLFRIINIPARGISNNTVKALEAYSVAHGVSIDYLLEHPQDVGMINTRAKNAVQRFGDMIRKWRATAGIEESDLAAGDNSAVGGHTVEPSLGELVGSILQESGLESYYRNDKSDPDRERLANLGELINSASQFESEYVERWQEENGNNQGDRPPLAELLHNYLQQVSLVADVDAVDTGEGCVTMMTLHAAKGLEFPVVGMIAVESGILPHQRAVNDVMGQQIEEERRLCFVGMTRAKKQLYMTHAQLRTVFGRTTAAIPSEFLSQLPEEAIEYLNLTDQAEKSTNWEDDYI